MRLKGNVETTPTRVLIGRFWFLTLPSVRAVAEMKTRRCARARLVFAQSDCNFMGPERLEHEKRGRDFFARHAEPEAWSRGASV